MSKMYMMIVEADTNDGDYVTSINTVTQEDLDRYLELLSRFPRQDISILSSRQPPSEMYNGLFTEDELEDLYDIIPTGEYGCHSIESITYCEIVEKPTVKHIGARWWNIW